MKVYGSNKGKHTTLNAREATYRQHLELLLNSQLHE